jgi:hypothetical protein
MLTGMEAAYSRSGEPLSHKLKDVRVIDIRVIEARSIDEDDISASITPIGNPD